MPKKRRKTPSIKKTKPTLENINYKELLLNALNYNKLNFLLGIITVIIIILVGYNFFLKNKTPILKIATKKQVQKLDSSPAANKKKLERKYKVKEGDTLWKIAEQFYGSGYNAVDIALANNINNPDLIYIDQQLIIPSVKPKLSTGNQIAATKTEKTNPVTKQYTVKPGDYLWKIAQEFYGDGFLWVKIAQMNKITNPNIIEPGQIILLP